MIFRILCSSIAVVIILSQPALAAHRPEFSRFRGSDTVTGTIQHVSRNTLEILDEDQKELRRFIYLGRLEQLQVGERVRVFLEPDNETVKIIKKMTTLDYHSHGQNLGYIFQK